MSEIQGDGQVGGALYHSGVPEITPPAETVKGETAELFQVYDPIPPVAVSWTL